MSERVEYLRMKAAEAVSYICAERGRIVTESYRATEGEVPVIRRAIALRDILENMSIVIDEYELLVGNHATRKMPHRCFRSLELTF